MQGPISEERTSTEILHIRLLSIHATKLAALTGRISVLVGLVHGRKQSLNLEGSYSDPDLDDSTPRCHTNHNFRGNNQ